MSCWYEQYPIPLDFVHEMMHVLCLQKKYFLRSYIKKIGKKNFTFCL